MFFDTILFDLDDTIHDRNKSLSKFIDLMMLRFCDRLDYASQPVLKRVFLNADKRGYSPREEVFKELRSEVLWKYKPSLEELIDFWNAEFPKCAQPMPGIYDVLDYYMGKGIKMGIVTNGGSVFQNTKIDKLNFGKYMETIVISEEAGIKKPDPEIFRIALTKINSANKTTLFVGDDAVVDVKGAINAGLIPVWLNRGKTWKTVGYAPHYIINDISELIALSKRFPDGA